MHEHRHEKSIAQASSQKSSRHGMAHEQSAAPSRARTPCINTSNNSHSSGQAQGDTRLEQNRQAALQSTPEHRTWQSIKYGKALGAHSAENQHSPLNTENTPQHGTQQGREHNSSPQSKHHTAHFTARAEHGHTEQSLAHATVHEHGTNTP
jgi:hypothetical protein